jgi:hypothetical protein
MRYSCAIFDYRRVFAKFAALELNLLLGKGWRPHAEEPTLGKPFLLALLWCAGGFGRSHIGGRNLPREVGSIGTLMESETNRVSNYEARPRIA